MKKKSISVKVLIMTICCMIACTVVFSFVYMDYKNGKKDELYDDPYDEILIDLNEINNMIEAYETDNNVSEGYETDNIVSEEYEADEYVMEEKAEDKANVSTDAVREKIRELMIKIDNRDKEDNDEIAGKIIVFYVISMIFIALVFSVVYIVILRPFERLENFASELSKGNFDVDLKYGRANMFGEFTWAFDHMRSELGKSREREREAVENNKTIIATLSHDIKTPVASIRAYAEGLSDNMDSSPERRKRYLDVIIKKCDEVSRVTDDMFVHSLHDLDRLVINKDKIDLDKVINDAISSMSGDGNDLKINGDLDKFVLEEGDGQRISQVIENIITNARKYAEGSVIEVWSRVKETEAGYYYELHIKDGGKGIPPEDLPFIFDKFYRGKNKGDKNGAGLGLFIVKYIMEAMGGSVSLNNGRDGLEVILTFINK